MKPAAPSPETSTLREEPVELRDLLAPTATPEAVTILGAPPPFTGPPGAYGRPAPTPAAPQLGGDRYDLEKILGQGSMGEVFKARDRFLRRRVAWKRMLPAVTRNPDLAARFLSEAQVTAQLDHPNIIPLYGLETTADGSVGYAMKFIEGETLSALLARHQAALATQRPAAEAGALADRLRIFTRICDGIAYAHAKGVLHRDLKPDNVMLGRFNQVYVVDWGICELLPRAGAGGTLPGSMARAPQKTGIMGTPTYMAPEQAAAQPLDERADVYALGMMLFELVSLTPARRGESVGQVLFTAVSGELPPLQHADPRVRIAAELRAIVARATAKEPAGRYPSVAALVSDIRHFQNGDAVSALPDTLWRKATRFVSRHRGFTLAMLLLLILVGAIGTFGQALRNERRALAERRHRQRTQRLLLNVVQHATTIEGSLRGHEALLHGLAGRAVAALSAKPVPELVAVPDTAVQKPGKPPKPARPTRLVRRGRPTSPAPEPASPAALADAKLYLAADFDDPDRAPEDLAEDHRYGQSISLSKPVFVLPPGQASPTPFSRELAALNGLVPTLKRGYAHGSADRDSGIYKLFVTLKSGVHVAYPGRGGFPKSYDGRQRPKYRLAAEGEGPRWGTPYPDLFDEPLLPCSFPLRGDDGAFLGVAGFDLLLPTVATKLLPMSRVPAVRKVFLIDDKGMVIAAWPASSAPQARRRAMRDRGELHDNASLALQPLPYPIVLEALPAEPRGGTREHGDEILAFAPLSALGYWVVAVADAATLTAPSAAPAGAAAGSAPSGP